MVDVGVSQKDVPNLRLLLGGPEQSNRARVDRNDAVDQVAA
jgi:hypothetical protein